MPDELTWDQRILRRVHFGFDEDQIQRNLRLSPTERLEQMESRLRDRGHEPVAPAHSPGSAMTPS